MEGQLYLSTGLDKVDTAIKRLVDNEPPEEYHLAFGAGKDSIVVDDLLLNSRISYKRHYAQTGIDPPLLVRFIREYYPDTIWHKPKLTMWQGIEQKGLPTRRKRWCCEYLKHFIGKGVVSVTGIRWAESARRKKYGEVSYLGNSKVVNPIIDWSDYDVWQYIREHDLQYCKLYDDGFKRLGCVMCPMTQRINRLREAELYPKFAAAYERANRRFYRRKERSEAEADEYFERWLNFP